MPDKNTPVSPENSRPDSWVLFWLTARPRKNREESMLIVAAIMVVIAVIEQFVSFWISFQLFYLVPILLSVAWLGWIEGCAAVVLCMLLRLAGNVSSGIFDHVAPLAVLWNRIGELCITFILVGVFHALLSLQRQLEDRVRQRTSALEQAIRTRERLERELLDIATRERKKIGRELHDDLCQHLVGTAFAAKVLAEQLTAQKTDAANDAQAIVKYMEESIAKTRGIARGLLLESIEPSDLDAELANLAAKGRESGVSCRFRLEGQPAIEDAATGAQLFRIAQEAMRNALRHGDPKHVDIVLSGDGEATSLTVCDDGTGLPPPDTRHEGMGLQIMEHRAALIGGTLSVIPAPGEGTRVVCQIPRPAAVHP